MTNRRFGHYNLPRYAATEGEKKNITSMGNCPEVFQPEGKVEKSGSKFPGIFPQNKKLPEKSLGVFGKKRVFVGPHKANFMVSKSQIPKTQKKKTPLQPAIILGKNFWEEIGRKCGDGTW